VCACAFPDVIGARKYIPALLMEYADPAVAENDGANACPDEAAGKCESARSGTPLEGGYASGTASDLFARVK